MLEVAEHYYHFGGKSPINEQNRALIAALEAELRRHGIGLPVYWGNRNWHPLLKDTIARMRDDGVEHALAFVTSACSSYSGCRQYRENIEEARAQGGSGAPVVDKIRVFFNHPGFIEAMAENVTEALAHFDEGARAALPLVFTAHSIPVSMARTSRYVEQLEEASRLVAERLGRSDTKLVYQSRSGSPSVPWLGPDVGEYLEELASGGKTRGVVVVPVGFLSDHMEVLYDLDVEAMELCERLGLRMVRAATVGTHPRFVAMIRELIEERLNPANERLALGTLGASHDVCPADCCPPPQRPVVVSPHAR
jgi:ferrochelatase